jgi:hypothetical protein
VSSARLRPSPDFPVPSPTFLLVRGRGWSRTDAASTATAAFIAGAVRGGLSGYAAGSSSP